MANIGSARDASGKAVVALYELTSQALPHILDFEIPAEDLNAVIVGGGIVASDNPGKLITASYPKADLSAWVVSAKDHIVPDPSPVRGFAIGLMVLDFEGRKIPKDDLMSFIHLTSVTSNVLSHPEARTPFWPQCKILSGGFRVNWSGEGSLATSSHNDIGLTGFPNATGDCWTARSKDHQLSSPASITVYTVSIEDPILGPQYRYTVRPGFKPADTMVAAGHPSVTAVLEEGYVMTGGGSQADFGGGEGNYLWKLEPHIDGQGRQSFTGASKDHLTPSPATMITRVYGIELIRIP